MPGSDEVAHKRMRSDLHNGIIDLFQIAFNYYWWENWNIDLKTRQRLKRGLTSSEVAYLLGVQNIVKRTGSRFEWLNKIQKALHDSKELLWFDPRNYMADDYRSTIFNRACTRLGKMGVLEYVERGGKWNTTYVPGLGIFDSPETIRRIKDEIRGHMEHCWSNGFVTLINHNRLIESGFSERFGIKDFPKTMCDDLMNAVGACGDRWVQEWEKRNGLSLESLSEYYHGKSASLYEKRYKKLINEEKFRADMKELGKEYSKRVPRFPLVVIDLNLDGWLL